MGIYAGIGGTIPTIRCLHHTVIIGFKKWFQSRTLQNHCTEADFGDQQSN